MALTIQSKASSPAPPRIIAGTLLGLTGLLFAAVATPHMIAGIVQIGGDPAAAAIERNLRTSPDMLDAAIESRRAALSWYETPLYHDQIAFAAMRNWIRLDGLLVKAPTAEHQSQQLAIDEFQRGLALQPAEPYAWHQLALVELVRSGASERTARYVKMSIRSGPNEPEIIVQRLVVAMMAWQKLDLETRAMVVGQVEAAAAYRTRELADVALRFGIGDFVTALLAGRPDLNTRFREMYFEPEEGSPIFREPAAGDLVPQTPRVSPK